MVVVITLVTISEKSELDKHQVSKDWIIDNHGSTHSASREA